MKPTQFEISIGGYMGDSCQLTWEDGSLIYQSWNAGDLPVLPQFVQPSEARWSSFWKKLEKLQVWSWEPEYPNPGIMDGTQWSIDLEWGGRSLHSKGDNNYPDGVDGEPGRNFLRFLRAVQLLIGGLKFE